MVKELYPARTREQNVKLIQGVVMPRSGAELQAGRDAFAAALHPSLFSELDVMEETIRPAMRAVARRHVDGLFDVNLPALLRMRAVELDVPDELLRSLARENREAFDAITGDEVLAAAVGEERVARMRAALVSPAPAEALPCPEAEALGDALANIRDGSTVPLVLQVAVQNAVLAHLDHPLSRARAKAWLRAAWEGHLPRIEAPEEAADLQSALSAQLGALATQAAEERLGRLAAVVRTAQTFLANNDLTAMRGFDGVWSCTVANCRRCSMRFASAALLVITPSAAKNSEKATLVLPLFNIVKCPYCGDVARVAVPAMFHSPDRAQVVYCVPVGRGQAPAEAIEELRPMFEDLRERYRSRLSPEAAAELDSAAEMVTHSVPDFLYAIQVGTTEPEWHAFLWVRFADGRWMAHDPAKDAMIEVTPEEHAAIRTALGDTGADADAQQRPPPSPGEGSVAGAIAAFNAGNYDLAREQLEVSLARDPGSTLVRRNLAAVYIQLGRMEDAQRVLSGETQQRR